MLYHTSLIWCYYINYNKTYLEGKNLCNSETVKLGSFKILTFMIILDDVDLIVHRYDHESNERF
jgi:hypothetical protein